jgi:hypothetical protein
MARHDPSGPCQGDHLFYYALGLGHVYQNEARMNQIKQSSRQAGCFGICPQHFHIPQLTSGDELSSQLNRGFVPLNSDYFPIRSDSLRKQIENPLWPAADVHRLVTGLNAELTKKPARVRCEFPRQPPETFLLIRAVSQQIFVTL